MDGIVRFSKLVVGGEVRRSGMTYLEESNRLYADSNLKKIFMSHKTGDAGAENEAKRITRAHSVMVYMAEWDPNVTAPAATALPTYLLHQIRTSHGFLVHVIPQITISMWVGYEIGGAQAYHVASARVEKRPAGPIPTVVSALDKLASEHDVDRWVKRHVNI